MTPVLITWIGVLALVGALSLLLTGQGRTRARQAFVILVSAFVVHSLIATTARGGRLARAEPVLESDRAELLLRFGSTMQVLEAKSALFALGSKKDLSDQRQQTFYKDARKILEESVGKSPDSAVLKMKLAVVLAESGQEQHKPEFKQVAKELASRSKPADSAAGKALLAIYQEGKVSPEEERTLERVLEKSLPPGWYRDATRLRLFETAGDTRRYEKLKAEIEDKSFRLMTNFLVVLAIAIVVSLIGIVVIIVQLFTLPRQFGDPEDQAGGASAVPWTAGTVYVVFVFWMATQVLIGGFTQEFIKSYKLLASGALVAAISTAALYLISNGPGVLYAYLLAFRPYGLGLFQAIRLRSRSGSLGPIRLTLAGIGTWCAAVPIVIFAYLLASRFLGAQGSSNPIIALVLEAARSSNVLATVLFYVTLGVLAPFVEETLFRGFLYRTLRKNLGVGTSLFASAALFAAVHMDAGAVVPLFCLGWLFGFVYERTRSLLPALIAHGLWNSGTFTLVLMIFGT
ncbi:MAG TPA: type II CAAX endopeptidase family protein [Candidatus Obscuribacterales bacterium]